VRKSTVATLGWNPSKLEFLDRDGNGLVGDKRRLETLESLGKNDLESASADTVCRVFYACNNYFHRCPYRWFNPLEKILKHIGASYYDGSACHLDLVQWATNPVWRRLSRSDQTKLIDADLPFLNAQFSKEEFRLLLLNGTGIKEEYEERLGGRLTESPLLRGGRLRLFVGHDPRGLKVVGWNINLQSTHGVTKEEIEAIGAAVEMAAQET
jgi:hypothetical protein